METDLLASVLWLEEGRNQTSSRFILWVPSLPRTGAAVHPGALTLRVMLRWRVREQQGTRAPATLARQAGWGTRF